MIQCSWLNAEEQIKKLVVAKRELIFNYFSSTHDSSVQDDNQPSSMSIRHSESDSKS